MDPNNTTMDLNTNLDPNTTIDPNTNMNPNTDLGSEHGYGSEYKYGSEYRLWTRIRPWIRILTMDLNTTMDPNTTTDSNTNIDSNTTMDPTTTMDPNTTIISPDGGWSCGQVHGSSATLGGAILKSQVAQCQAAITASNPDIFAKFGTGTYPPVPDQFEITDSDHFDVTILTNKFQMCTVASQHVSLTFQNVTLNSF